MPAKTVRQTLAAKKPVDGKAVARTIRRDAAAGDASARKAAAGTAGKVQAPTASSPTARPPRRAAREPAPVRGVDARVNGFLAAYIMGVANRLANDASAHYRAQFNLGMTEWRTLMAIGDCEGLIVREVSEHADMDYAAASKSLRVLHARGLVGIEQTRSRGRAALARLTPAGLSLWRELQATARLRHRRLHAAFTAQEIETLWELLRRVEAQVGVLGGRAASEARARRDKPSMKET